MSVWYVLTPVTGVIALLFAFYLTTKIDTVSPGNDKMCEIAAAIHEGAMAFLRREYKMLGIFIVCLAAIIALVGVASQGTDSLQPTTAVAFVIGAVCSILAGNIGMRVATRANCRTANAAAQSGLNKALEVAFSGGAVMGMCVTGLGLLGLGIVILLFPGQSVVINGFALGASSVALFGRVGGGIYTKAADIGADLVGKLEAGIPEDDPRNPAVIADNVGDNVGDVAGMGSDLFESYVGSIVAALALGSSFAIGNQGEGVLVPLMIGMVGVIASIIGTFFVSSAGEDENPQKSLNMGTLAAMAIAVIGIFAVTYIMLPTSFTVKSFGVTAVYSNIGVFFAALAGLLAGFVIGKLTEYYTSADYKPVQDIARSCQTGTATNIISGIATGMGSTAYPILVIAAGHFIGLRICRFIWHCFGGGRDALHYGDNRGGRRLRTDFR